MLLSVCSGVPNAVVLLCASLKVVGILVEVLGMCVWCMSDSIHVYKQTMIKVYIDTTQSVSKKS